MALPFRAKESSPSIALGPGLTMRMFLCPSAPVDHQWRRFTETTFDPSVPGAVALEVPPHWHTGHAETLVLLEGQVDVTLGLGASAQVKRLEPGGESAFVPRGSVHSIKAAPRVKMVLREATTLGDSRDKELFFRDLFQLGTPTFWLSMRAFLDADGYVPLLGGVSPLLDRLFVGFFGTIAKLIAPPRPELPKERTE